MSVQKNIHNTLHINPNCNIVQDSTNITFDTIVLLTTTNCIINKMLSRKNSQKFSDIKIEDSYPYIVELVQNMPNYRISGISTGQFWLGDWITLCKYMSNEDKNYMDMIDIQTAIIMNSSGIYGGPC